MFGRTYALPPADPGPGRVQKPLSAASIVVLVGIAIGALTLLGQAVLDPYWNRLANSGAVWVTGAFLVGSLMPSSRAAVAAGLGTLIGAVVGYYLVAQVVAGAGVSASSLAIWLGTAVGGGPLFGLAGHWWRAIRQPERLIAVALLAGVFVAEGASTLIRIPELGSVGWVEIAVGVVVLGLLGRSNPERMRAFAAMLPIAAVGVLAYGLIDMAFSLR